LFTVRASALVLGGVLAAAVVRPAVAQAPAPVTFSKHIAPIFQQKCQECHRPGSIAPMSLITFDDARKHAASIAQMVAAREMPPWHLDKDVGIRAYKNDRSLSGEQIALITS
jgi:mono/diheme cytochrome c family protein